MDAEAVQTLAREAVLVQRHQRQTVTVYAVAEQLPVMFAAVDGETCLQLWATQFVGDSDSAECCLAAWALAEGCSPQNSTEQGWLPGQAFRL